MAEPLTDPIEGPDEPARQKTLGEQPVSDADIAKIHEDIKEVNEDLNRLKAEGDRVFGDR